MINTTKNIALSPIGYWPYGSRRAARAARKPSWSLPLLLAGSLTLLTLASCSQWVNTNGAVQATINRAINAGMQYIAANTAWTISRVEKELQNQF